LGGGATADRAAGRPAGHISGGVIGGMVGRANGRHRVHMGAIPVGVAAPRRRVAGQAANRVVAVGLRIIGAGQAALGEAAPIGEDRLAPECAWPSRIISIRNL